MLQSLKRYFTVFSCKLVQREYEKIKSLQLPQFFKVKRLFIEIPVDFSIVFAINIDLYNHLLSRFHSHQ